MTKEKIYTETSVAGEYTLLLVDVNKKQYEIVDNLSEESIDELCDFIAPDLFDALLIGLRAKKYKEIK